VAEIWIEAAKINVKSSRCRSCCCPTADRIPLSPCCVRDSTMSFSVPRPINVYLCGGFLHQCLIRHETVTMHSSTAKSLEIYSELTPSGQAHGTCLRSAVEQGRGESHRGRGRGRGRDGQEEGGGPFCDCKRRVTVIGDHGGKVVRSLRRKGVSRARCWICYAVFVRGVW
jgi:hypothetical protein